MVELLSWEERVINSIQEGVLIDQSTIAMWQGPSGNVRFLKHIKVLRILWNAKFQYCERKSLLNIHIASKTKIFYNIPSHLRLFLLLPSHLQLDIPTGFLPSGFPTKTLYIVLLQTKKYKISSKTQERTLQLIMDFVTGSSGIRLDNVKR